MGSWVLIVFMYAGAMSKSDSVALTNVPGFQTQRACEAAGRRAVSMASDTYKSGRFVCVNQEDPKKKN